MAEGFPLATAFASRVQLEGGFQPSAELERALAAMFARGRAAWPALGVDATTFARYVAERVAAAGPPGKLPDLFAEDLLLACAAGRGDRAAIDAVERRYLAGLASSLAKGGIDVAVAEEVVQLLRTRLFVAGGGGSARGSSTTRGAAR